MRKKEPKDMRYCQNVACKNGKKLHKIDIMVQYDGILFCSELCYKDWLSKEYFPTLTTIFQKKEPIDTLPQG
jgi:hypothetical protein